MGGNEVDLHEESATNIGLIPLKKSPRKRQRPDELLQNTGNPISVAEEIWEQHFENLDDPIRIDNILAELRIINHSRKAAIIFDKILNKHYLQKETLLNFRLVCRSWNDSVRNYIQNHPSHLDLDGGYHLSAGLQTCFISRTNPKANLPHYYYNMDKMISQYPPNSNPFLGRNVCFCIDGYVSRSLPPGQDAHNWCGKARTLLERYGVHVWYFTVHFGEDSIDVTKAYRLLHEWIWLMPNLKVVKVFYEDFMKEGILADLQNEIKTHPLPQLAGLVFLSTGNLPWPIVNEITSRVPKDGLKKLQINPGTAAICSSNANGIHKYDWLHMGGNVEEASITVESRSDFLSLESADVKWPLKKLYLDLDIHDVEEKDDDDPSSKWINWNRIFSFLEHKFGSTITKLELDLPREGRRDFTLKNVILEHSLQYRLNLVHVKKLYLKIYNVTAIDFLLPMKDSLDELCIEFCLVDWSEVDPQTLAMIRDKEIIKLHSSKIFHQPNRALRGVKVKINDEFNLTQFIQKEFTKLKKGTIKFSNCFVVKI